MNESTITLQGYVGGDPTLRTAVGHPVAHFRLACTPRRLNRATGEWSDAPTQWYSVSAWRMLGQNVADSVRKGDPVVVHGRLEARHWVDRDGQERHSFEVEATTVGHDLNRGCSRWRKNSPRPAVAGGDAPTGRGDAEDGAALNRAGADSGGPADERPGAGSTPSTGEAVESGPDRADSAA